MKLTNVVIVPVLVLFYGTIACAQNKIKLDDWVTTQKDSLNRIGVDTVVFYHHYCGECSVLVSKAEPPHCDVIDNGWTFIDGAILYKQKGHTYSLKFNYCNLPIKTELTDSHSLSYFISIIPTLKKRDQAYVQRRKAMKFFPPVPVDGSYQEATLYLKKRKVEVSLNYSQKTDLHQSWKVFFWIDKEIKLLDLIEKELK